MSHLFVREPGRVAFTVELGDVCAVGRDTENDVVLSDRLVSRRHLSITRADKGWVVRDLQSTHGTYVNGARAAEHPLRDRDQVQLGNVIIVFRADSPDAAAVFSATAVGDPRGRAADPEARRLHLLYDVSRAIGALADPDELIGRMLDGALEVLEGGSAVVGLIDRPGVGARRIARSRGADELVLSDKLLEGLLARRESAIWRTPGGSALGAPLLVGGRAIGFIAVARARPVAEAELDFLTALAHVTAAAVEQAGEQRRLARVAEALRDERTPVEMLGDSEPMRKLKARVVRYAGSDAAVLIRGESGTGKELVARTLHTLSQRSEQPFVAVNCAAIPDTLIESELFGHEKGAFTGALKRRRGKFALAHQGTLFLDEVGDLSPAAQAKVLRAIEEGEIQPVGAEDALAVDARIVSATHRPLEEDIAAGRFRADLFYRLNVADVEVPPLRARGDDVVVLAESFLARAAQRLGRRVTGFTPEALETLRRYPWPGNVRQLGNEVERALLLSEGPVVDLEDLRLRVEATGDDDEDQATTIADAERQAVARALEDSGGNIVAAARALGVARGTLYRKLKKYKLLDGD
jgi:Nif-specific regulatory protein